MTHSRHYALKFQRPLTLQATINPPTQGDDPTDPLAHSINGFLMLVSLFRPFDDALVNLWNKTRGSCQQHYLAVLDKQYREAAQNLMNTDPHFGDTVKNQQWLKHLVWQIGNGGEVSYQYPMDVSSDVLSMASSFTAQGINNLSSVSLVRYCLIFFHPVSIATNVFLTFIRPRNFSPLRPGSPMCCRCSPPRGFRTFTALVSP